MGAQHCKRNDIVNIVELQLQMNAQHYATSQSCCSALHRAGEGESTVSQPSCHDTGWDGEVHDSVPKLEVSSPSTW